MSRKGKRKQRVRRTQDEIEDIFCEDDNLAVDIDMDEMMEEGESHFRTINEEDVVI